MVYRSLFILVLSSAFLASTFVSSASIPNIRPSEQELEEGFKQLEIVAEIAKELAEEVNERKLKEKLTHTILGSNLGSRSKRAPQSSNELKGCAAGAGAFAATNALATAAAPNPFTAIAGAISGLIFSICSAF